ncbi:hypothetical protein JCM14036_29390 [Desulfotomaculum defluvii]
MQDIAQKSQTLYERLGFASTNNTLLMDMEKAERRLKQWRDFAAASDNLVFAKRLAWDGIDEETALQLMTDKIPGQEHQENPWMTLLKEVLGQVGCVTAEELRKSPHAFNDQSHPFAEIHLLFVNIGIRQLYSRCMKLNDLLTPQALTSLVRFLMLRLSFISVDVLQAEMERRNIKYPSFIDALLKGEIFIVFGKYTVIARLMSQFTLFWIESSAQLLNALADDMELISETFGGQRHLGRVNKIECGLSDPHNGGRSVVKLEFENKLKLIFKPRDLGIEESFFQFAREMNVLENEDMFWVLKILNKGKHGWVEYCQQLPCSNECEVANYYRHSGMLLCIMYLLAGSDFHHENIIAQGEYPIPVDLEVMLQPPSQHEKINSGEYSVLRTLLLPVQFFQGQGGYFSLEGLGYSHNGEPANARSTNRALVYLDGKQINPQDYLKDIEEGFKKAYTAILRHRDKLLSTSGPLSVFENKKVRYVFRKTELYLTILYNSLRSHYLETGILRSIRLDKICRPLVACGAKPAHWGIIRSEHEAFDRGDIPIFYINTCGTHLENEKGHALEGFFTETPMANLRSRISGMSNDDMIKQCGLIRESFRLKEAITQDIKKQVKEPTMDRKQRACMMHREQLLSLVQSIANYICDRAIVTEGSMNWLNPVAGFNRCIELNIMKDNLYSGKAGICLFLSACRKILGDKAYFRFTQTELVDEMTRTAERIQKEDSRIERLGAGNGIGGIIYALVKVWEFTADESILSKALQISRAISDQLIAKDTEYDVISGSSGAILGLLALYEAYPAKEVLQRAINCSEHLLRCRIKGLNGLKAWKPAGMFTLDNQPVPAFSRGTSGIAMALSRLYRVTGQERYMESAREALWYENDVLQNKEYVWPGLNIQKPEIQLSWCTGAAGICISRLEANDIIGVERRNYDLQAALSMIRCAGDLSRDDLCWGNFGLIDVLVTASGRLKDEELYNEALKRAARYFADLKDSYGDLSFFNGLSGIGYVLLRLVDRQLPSVLAFQ